MFVPGEKKKEEKKNASVSESGKASGHVQRLILLGVRTSELGASLSSIFSPACWRGCWEIMRALHYFFLSSGHTGALNPFLRVLLLLPSTQSTPL